MHTPSDERILRHPSARWLASQDLHRPSVLVTGVLDALALECGSSFAYVRRLVSCAR